MFPKVPMTLTESSTVAQIGYDPELEALHVRYKQQNGRYVYMSVSRSTARKVMEADSIGRAINRYIKPNYEFVLMRVDD